MTCGVNVSPEHHRGSKFPTGINKPLHLSRVVGSHFLVHIHINILSTVVIKPNIFLLASSMWCTNAPNNEIVVKYLITTMYHAANYWFLSLCWLKVFLLLVPLCCAVCCDWLIFFFFFSLLSALAAGDRCWVLLSGARCVGSRDQVQHSSNTLMGIGTPGSQRRRFYPHQPCRGRAERVSVSLCWCTCSGKIVITNCELLFFCYPPTAALQHPTSWFFLEAVLPLIAQLPNWSHWHKHFLFSFTSCMQKKKNRRCCLCTCETQREHPVVKMEWKRKCRGGERKIILTIFGSSR